MSLIKSLEQGDVAKVQSLLQAGADPNERAEWGDSALMIASSLGSSQLVDLLLQNGADPSIADEDGETCLHVASGQKEVFERLIKAGAPINHQDEDGNVPMMNVLSDPDLVHLLLKNGADPNVVSNDGNAPISECARWGYEVPARILLDAGADPNGFNKESGTLPLFYAAGAGFASIVELLLDCGANPDRATPSGETPLSVALQKGNIDAALVLAERSSEATRKASLAISATLHQKIQRLMRFFSF